MATRAFLNRKVPLGSYGIAARLRPTRFPTVASVLVGAYARALEDGCTSLTEPADRPQGQRVAWVRDPFGTLLDPAVTRRIGVGWRTLRVAMSRVARRSGRAGARGSCDR